MIQNIEYNNRYEILFAILTALRNTPIDKETVVQFFFNNWDLRKYDNVDYDTGEVLTFESKPEIDTFISRLPMGTRSFVSVTDAYAQRLGLNTRGLKTPTRFAILNRMRARKMLISILHTINANSRYIINEPLKMAMEKEIERRITSNGRITLKQLNDRGVLTTREYLMAPEMHYYKGDNHYEFD